MYLAGKFDSKSKVLVVDDLQTVRKVVIKQLANIGVNCVEQASNGQAAIELVKKGDISLIISDWMMPEMDGLGLLKEIKACGYDKIPFIMITSLTEKDSVIEAAKEGVSDYIVKPFTEDILAKKIDNAILKAQSITSIPQN